MSRVLIVSPHPDDAELAMGGTIAKIVSKGYEVLIVDLTDGEPTPLGSRDVRLKEAERAAEILRVQRKNLGLVNRKLVNDLQSRRVLAEKIRRFRPDIMFGPALPDYHPDHVEANGLVEYARFDAKLCKADMAGSPWWVSKYYQYYSLHRGLVGSPSFVIDISGYWEAKLSAVRAYQSQILHKSASNYHVGLVEKMQITHRYLGLAIGAKYAEAFYSQGAMRFDI